MGRNIAGSSDVIIKMDTDEFLMIYDEGTKSLKPNISEYLSGYAKDESHQLRLKQHTRFGYVQKSLPSTAICQNDIHTEAEKFPVGGVEFLGNTRKAFWKGLWSSSRFFEIEEFSLGGHAIGVAPDIWTDMGALHFHDRCVEIELENSKRALVRHEYMSEDDTKEEAIAKLTDVLNCPKEGLCDEGYECKVKGVESFHKVQLYLSWLACTDQFIAQYNRHDGKGAPHPDLLETSRIAHEKYAPAN